MKHLLTVACLLMAIALLGGCKGKSGGGTPESVAQAFADAMAHGDTGKAADLWNYVTEARASNENWDEIPSGQRGQIIGKLKETKRGELEPSRGSFGKGMKADPGEVSGTSATVTLQGGPQGPVLLRLEQADGVWGVVGIGQ